MKARQLILQGLFGTAVLLASETAFAQGVSVDANASGGAGDGFLAAGHIFFFNDEASLGGDELSTGSAFYTRFDAQYNMQQYYMGFGLFYERDTFGEDQADTIMGPVVEFVLGSFFLKIMPGFIEQTFENRSFAKRAGSFFAIEPGIRGSLYQGLFFYEVAIHQRTLTINQEDSRDMEDKIETSQTMPMLGMGISL